MPVVSISHVPSRLASCPHPHEHRSARTCLASKSTTVLALVSTPVVSRHPIHPVLCFQNPRTAPDPAVRSDALWRDPVWRPSVWASTPTSFPHASRPLPQPHQPLPSPTAYGAVSHHGVFPHALRAPWNPLCPVLPLANSYSSGDSSITPVTLGRITHSFVSPPTGSWTHIHHCICHSLG